MPNAHIIYTYTNPNLCSSTPQFARSRCPDEFGAAENRLRHVLSSKSFVSRLRKLVDENHSRHPRCEKMGSADLFVHETAVMIRLPISDCSSIDAKRYEYSHRIPWPATMQALLRKRDEKDSCCTRIGLAVIYQMRG
jgi:hypothetical protein